MSISSVLSLLLMNYILPGMLLVAKSLLCSSYFMLFCFMAIFSSNILPATIRLLPPPTVRASVYLLGSQNVCPAPCATLNPRQEKLHWEFPGFSKGC